MNATSAITYAYIEHLKKSNPAVRLLSIDSASLVLSFLYQTFPLGVRSPITHDELASRLGDYLYAINSEYGAGTYEQTPKQYLDLWTGAGFLRKYISDQDEQVYEPTPAVGKVYEWIHSLTQRQFIGTESRILTILGLLKSMVTETLQDPVEVVNELERQKAEIQARIDRIKQGGIEPHDPTRIIEQFYQVEDAVSQLLSDFSQIDKNFRDLNQKTKQTIATSDLPKGALLTEVFGDHEQIWKTPQGRTFKAFWELMMSPEMQEEMDKNIQHIYSLPEIKELAPNKLVFKTRQRLLEEGGHVYKSNSKLAEQLRKYLDTRVQAENRLIMELMRPIEEKALAICQEEGLLPARETFMEIPDTGIQCDLFMAHHLYSIPVPQSIDSSSVQAGEATDADALLLFQQKYIDREQLRQNIGQALERQSQITLPRLLEEFPPEHGVAEIVIYLDIAHTSGGKHIVDTTTKDTVLVHRPDGTTKAVTMYRIIFSR